MKSGADRFADADEDIARALKPGAEAYEAQTPNKENILLLFEAMRILPDYTEDWLAHDIQTDIVEFVTGRVPGAPLDTPLIPGPGIRKSVVQRLHHRIAGMRLALRKHYDSDAFKEAKVVGLYIGTPIGLISGLWAIFFGV